jgi:UPF0716 protein FxsA
VLPVIVVLFILVPIAELAVIIKVGGLLGFWWTLALLVADSVLGSMLMRAQGRAAWRRFNAALQSGRVPARETLDGACVILGGALLLTPGFLTDIGGLALLLPPSRAVIRRVATRRLEARMLGGAARFPRRGGSAPGPAGPARNHDIEGSAVEDR